MSKKKTDRMNNSDCDQVFIEATYQDKQRAAGNNSNSICRFEFLEALVRICQKKYVLKVNGGRRKEDDLYLALLN